MNKKAVLITGAASGTGFAIAERFAKDGYAVFVSSRDEATAQKAAKYIAEKYGVFASGLKLGLGSELDMDNAFRQIKSSAYYLEALVLNAADLGLNMPILTTCLDDWSKVIHTNLVGNFMLIQQAARIMTEQGGSIVFVGSNTATRAIKNRSAYIASKGGINSMVKALAVELGEYGIRTNCVAAGSIKTARWDKLPPEKQEANKLRVPVQDIADFEDIANAVYFLSSAAAKNITGAVLTVDGGADAQLFPNT